jgi:antitoxin FitA
MGTRNLDDRVKHELRKRAAADDLSMEEEAPVILCNAVIPAAKPHEGHWRLKAPREEILTRLGIKPDKPLDLKKLSDEMWDEGLL